MPWDENTEVLLPYCSNLAIHTDIAQYYTLSNLLQHRTVTCGVLPSLNHLVALHLQAYSCIAPSRSEPERLPAIARPAGTRHVACKTDLHPALWTNSRLGRSVYRYTCKMQGAMVMHIHVVALLNSP